MAGSNPSRCKLFDPLRCCLRQATARWMPSHLYRRLMVVMVFLHGKSPLAVKSLTCCHSPGARNKPCCCVALMLVIVNAGAFLVSTTTIAAKLKPVTSSVRTFNNDSIARRLTNFPNVGYQGLTGGKSAGSIKFHGGSTCGKVRETRQECVTIRAGINGLGW